MIIWALRWNDDCGLTFPIHATQALDIDSLGAKLVIGSCLKLFRSTIYFYSALLAAFLIYLDLRSCSQLP